jgi:hypothetical protein
MTISYKKGTIKATLTDSLAAELRYDAFNERAPQIAGSQIASNARDAYCRIAAHSEDVKGSDWQPPSMFATTDDLRESMELFFKLFDVDQINPWMDEIGKLLMPTASAEEQGAGEENPTTAQPGD